MPTNPYEGTENAEHWQQGYDYGYEHYSDPAILEKNVNLPDDGSPLSEAEWQVWYEGAAEGSRVKNAEVNPVPHHPGGEEHDHTAEYVGHGAVEAADWAHTGHTVVHAATHATQLANAGKSAVSIASGAVGAALIVLFVGLIIAEDDPPPPEEHTTDPAVMARWFGGRCTELGCSELFMAYCKNTDAAHSGSDALFSAGWWHGNVHRNESAEALNEAKAHLESEPKSEHLCGILRFEASSPDTVELVPLEFEHSS